MSRTRRASSASSSTSASATRSVRADWSSARCALDGRGRSSAVSSASPARFLFLASGYYDYDAGLPARAGRRGRDFAGRSSIRNSGPTTSTYAGKTVAVIGSGATAVTLVPALARQGGARDDGPALAELHRRAARRGTGSRAGCSAGCRRLADGLIRWKNVLLTIYFYGRARRKPEQGQRAGSRAGAPRRCRPDYRVERDFSRPTGRGTSACALSPTATCSRRWPRQGPDRDRRDRALHAERAAAGERRSSGGGRRSSPPPGLT